MIILALAITTISSFAQDIWDFGSIRPGNMSGSFRMPSSHDFQYLVHEDQFGTPGTYDFTAFVPANGSNTRGHLSLNHELSNGSVSLFSIAQNNQKRWNLSFMERFTGLNRPCSGCVTSWGDVLVAEENPAGRVIQITPTAAQGQRSKIFDTLGILQHENVAENRGNQRTFYTGEDVRSGGHVFKFVADSARQLGSGTLYVLKVNGSRGDWLRIDNPRNARAEAESKSATKWPGVEDVEISPIDGMVYFAVKGNSIGTIYRFQENTPLGGGTVSQFAVYAGDGASYNTGNGTESFRDGVDNLAFDNAGNLWALQDGGGSRGHYIWVVDRGHTTASPRVRIFGQAPTGSEPTGITFTPDNKFLFMSIQHPNGNNSRGQPDVFDQTVPNSKNFAVVIARNESWTAAPSAPVITSAGTKSGQVGQFLTYQITADGNPTSFSTSTLPGGLSVNSSGRISGTPTTAGTFNVTLRATNAGGTGEKNLRITISAALPPRPVVTSAGTANGRVGAFFRYQITALNNPTSFNVSGSLPPGLSLNRTTGLISGTPTSAQTRTVTISATNAGGAGSKSLVITISAALPPRPAITSAGSASGRVGAFFRYQITALNNPTSFNVSGTLPPGLSINRTTGLISGTPTSAQTRTVTISATNAGGAGSKSLMITISAALPPRPVITSAGSANGRVGAFFRYQITALNNPTSFNVAGTLPPGLSINRTTGLISGTPTSALTRTVILSATNAGGTGSKSLLITISAAPPQRPTITSAGSATGRVGASFRYQITASNNPTGFGASGLPPGLRVDTRTGLISGTPTTAGTTTASISAQNAGGIGQKILTITISSGNLPPEITSPTSVNAEVGKLFEYFITANNGVDSWGFDDRPSWMRWDAERERLWGYPTAQRVHRVEINARNQFGRDQIILSINVRPAAAGLPVVSQFVRINKMIGVYSNHPISASNNPTRFRILEALPPGIGINSSSGTVFGRARGPIQAPRTYTLEVSNAVGSTRVHILIAVVDPPPDITSPSYLGGIVGTAVRYEINATNNPLSFYLIGGPLPTGLDFDYSNGVISGTPTTPVTKTVRVRASNGGGSDEIELTIEISRRKPVVTNADSYQLVVGTPFSLRLTATEQPGAFDISGTMPPGLSFDFDTATISGTPTSDGDWSIYPIAYNGAGRAGKSIKLQITLPSNGAFPAINGAQNGLGRVGVFARHYFHPANDATIRLASGSLPPGMTLNSTAGYLQGTPTTAGQYKFSIRASNSRGSRTMGMTYHVSPAGGLAAYRPNTALYFSQAHRPPMGLGSSNGGRYDLRERNLWLGGGYGRPAAAYTTLTLNLKDRENVTLRFIHENRGDDISPALDNQRSINGDGVFLRVDGNWHLLRDYSRSSNRSYLSVNISQFAAARNIVLSESCQLVFRFESDDPHPTRGRLIDNITVTASNPSSLATVAMRQAASGKQDSLAERPPEGGETLMLAAEDGEVSFTMPAGYRSVLATDLPSDAVVTDVTDPAAPVELKVPLLKTSAGHAAYFSVAPGRSIYIH